MEMAGTESINNSTEIIMNLTVPCSRVRIYQNNIMHTPHTLHIPQPRFRAHSQLTRPQLTNWDLECGRKHNISRHYYSYSYFPLYSEIFLPIFVFIRIRYYFFFLFCIQLLLLSLHSLLYFIFLIWSNVSRIDEDNAGKWNGIMRIMRKRPRTFNVKYVCVGGGRKVKANSSISCIYRFIWSHGMQQKRSVYVMNGWMVEIRTHISSAAFSISDSGKTGLFTKHMTVTNRKIYEHLLSFCCTACHVCDVALGFFFWCKKTARTKISFI